MYLCVTTFIYFNTFYIIEIFYHLVLISRSLISFKSEYLYEKNKYFKYENNES